MSRSRTRHPFIRIERLLLFERRAAPARPWAPDGLELDRPTCVTLCYTGLEPATRACAAQNNVLYRTFLEWRRRAEVRAAPGRLGDPAHAGVAPARLRL